MPQILLTVATTAETRDIAVDFDDRTTVAQVTDALAEGLGISDASELTIERTSRRTANLDRKSRLSHNDLRSGDTIRLAPDTGLRDVKQRIRHGELHVTAGPDKGRIIELSRGDSTIGRAAKCDITLNDSLASRQHAKFIVTDVVEVADLGSTNGVLVNDTQIGTPRRLANGDKVLIGDTELTIDLAGISPAELDNAGNTVEFNRPPRVGSPYSGAEVELPAPPDNPARQRLPMVVSIIPVFMGVGLYFLTRNIASVAFIAMSPLLIIGSWWENKRSGRADHKDRLAEFEEDLVSTIAELDIHREQEVAARFNAAPNVQDLLGQVEQLSSRLWERQPEDEDFLELRVGLAPQPSLTVVKIKQGGARDRQAELADIPPRYRTLPPVPVTVSLTEVGALGVAGPTEHSSAMVRSLVAQSAVLQSPSELVVAALVSPEMSSDWEWLKWLPHARAPLSPISGPHLTTELDEHLGLLNEVIALIEDRDSDAFGADRVVFEPHLLLVIDDGISLERARLMPLLERGPAAGISILWVSSSVRRLPKACGAVVDIGPSGAMASVGYVQRQLTIDASTCEVLDGAGAASIARLLSPIIDVSSRQSGDAEIPRTAPLVELLGGTAIMDDSQLILERWHESATGHGLRGPVGAGGSGVFSIDLRHDGPHGLVAGTTGAGKSEFLQGMLVGLAATHSPNRVTFLMVDYKGGSAFKDCVKLPHTVGLVTDLTPALVKRSLISLRAELHRREHLLNEANAKDLIQMEEEQHPNTPPSLIIVVDEFAALAREVPEFVDGVVDVAQRGRSLGLHLMLATQRPAGVVTDNIRANTNLKVALRVASADESTDVIGSPAAGNLDRSTPGRAFARLGPSELIPFQSAYVGGRTTSADDDTALSIGNFGLTGVEPWENVGRSKNQIEGDTDLERMVDRINEAFVEARIPRPKRPWLDPLSGAYDLLRLPRSADDRSLTFGVADDPAQQTQRVVAFNPDHDGSLLIFGGGGTGKTVALRTLALAASLTSDATPTHIYGLDFAGRALEMLSPLPQVGSIINGDDYERVVRLLTTLKETLDERSDRYARHRSSSLTEYRANTADREEARILILLDGFENFQSAYERIDRGQWLELVSRLVADGRAVGIHFAMTGGRRTSFPMALASAVPRRLVLRLANTDEYLSVGVDVSLIDGDEPAGRAIDGTSVVQIAVAGVDASTAGQANAIKRLAETLRTDCPAPPIRVLPDELSITALGPSPGSGLTVGLDERLEDFVIPRGDRILITGPTRSGKSTALQTIAQITVAAGSKPIVLCGKRAVGQLPEGVTPVVGATAITEFMNSSTLSSTDVVIIDNLEDLFDSDADFALQTALAMDDLTVFAACEVTQARRGFSPLLGLMKRSRRTLIFLPDADLDGDLANCPLPRTNRRFVPGRGYYSDAGQLTLVQIGM